MLFISVDPAFVDFARQLGDAGEELASRDPLPTASRVIETLGAIAFPETEVENVRPPDQARRAHLAAAVSGKVCVNSRLELYPPGLSAERALALSRSALFGVRELRLEEIRSRVASRYPQAEPLPGRPQLDRLLEQVGFPLQWDDRAANGAGAYGQGQGLSFEIARSVREMLLSDENSPRWSTRCRTQIGVLRDDYRAKGIESTGCVSDQTENHVAWWNFAGRFLNESFASVLETNAGIDARFDDFSLRVPYVTDVTLLSSTIRRMLADPDALQRLPISKRWLDGLKFSDCLPELYALRAARGRIRVTEDVLGEIRI